MVTPLLSPDTNSNRTTQGPRHDHEPARGVAFSALRLTGRLSHPALRHRFFARNRRRGSLRDRRALSCGSGHRSLDPVSIACRPPGGAGHPHHHRDGDHDGGLHRFCDPADDIDACVHAVFAAHPCQLHAGSGDAMGAWDLSWHVFLLHCGSSRGAFASLAFCAGCHRRRRHGACPGLRWLAHLFHPPHFGCHQRQHHHRPHQARDRRGHRRADALSAPGG